MNELIKILVGVCFVVLGFFLGNFLAKITKDELNSGQNWFKIIIFLSSIGVIVNLIIGNDILLFSFLFIVAVTSISLITKRISKNQR